MSGIDQAVGGPLVDQNGRFARYELRMNWDEYNYITTNTLWDTAGQNKFLKHNTVSLPAGPTSYGPVGAMELKAAWKVLGKGDDASKFYTIKAIVYNDDSGDPSPGENPVTLGLIGLHIARKTATQRNWVWSTFEQVDNLSTSFYNSACDTCRVNTPISGSNITELDANGKPLHAPTQVTRVNPIQDPSADSLNTHFQALLKGSVWANYKLVSTQWLLFENMFPLYLANSVQETYVQGPNPLRMVDFHCALMSSILLIRATSPFRLVSVPVVWVVILPLRLEIQNLILVLCWARRSRLWWTTLLFSTQRF